MKDRTVRSAPWLPLIAAVVSAWAAGGACSRGVPRTQATESSTPPVRISGTEKLVWEQIVTNATQVPGYRFFAYIDDETPVVLAGVTCAPAAASNTFTCSATLPKMRPGLHRLQVAAEEADNQKRTGPKSGIIVLDVVTTKTP